MLATVTHPTPPRVALPENCPASRYRLCNTGMRTFRDSDKEKQSVREMEPEGWRNGDRAAEKAQRASAKTFPARKHPLWQPPTPSWQRWKSEVPVRHIPYSVNTARNFPLPEPHVLPPSNCPHLGRPPGKTWVHSQQKWFALNLFCFPHVLDLWLQFVLSLRDPLSSIFHAISTLLMGELARSLLTQRQLLRRAQNPGAGALP